MAIAMVSNIEDSNVLAQKQCFQVGALQETITTASMDGSTIFTAAVVLISATLGLFVAGM
jgi:hypothetical protein